MAAGENKLEVCSMDLAVHVLRFTERCKGHYALINQLETLPLLLSARTFGRQNTHMAVRILLAKLQIALKEVLRDRVLAGAASACGAV